MSEYIRIGDLLALYEDAAEGYVGGEGVLQVQVGLRESSHPHHLLRVSSEAVFRLRQQQNYSVTRQMRAFLEREELSAQEAMLDERYQAFLPDRERERATNLQEFENSRGRTLRYGMIVQLEHYGSHKSQRLPTRRPRTPSSNL